MADSIIDTLKTKKPNKHTIPRLINLMILCLSLNILFCLALYYSYMNPPEPNYFITSFNGQVEKLMELNQPNTSDSVVKQWANIATIDIFTYDFVNYEKSCRSTRRNYFGIPVLLVKKQVTFSENQ